jgi:hypothetical protein
LPLYEKVDLSTKCLGTWLRRLNTPRIRTATDRFFTRLIIGFIPVHMQIALLSGDR